MVRFYTNRELAERLEIKLAKWKRWAREFLPPDPLGGMQSGYARQYLMKDVFIVLIGGHLVSHLKFSVPEARTILKDLHPWLKKSGFFKNIENNGSNDKQGENELLNLRIYIKIKKAKHNGFIIFRYLVRKTLSLKPMEKSQCQIKTEQFEETYIPVEPDDPIGFFDSEYIRLLNISALYKNCKNKLINDVSTLNKT